MLGFHPVSKERKSLSSEKGLRAWVKQVLPRAGSCTCPHQLQSRTPHIAELPSLWFMSSAGAGSAAQARATTARRRAPRHSASAPLPPQVDKSAPPRTTDSGHADAHTHLVREAPEVSHVPADVTSPSQPLHPLASSTCKKPQAAGSTAAGGPVPWRPFTRDLRSRAQGP